jgi:hypothetical protein
MKKLRILKSLFLDQLSSLDDAKRISTFQITQAWGLWPDRSMQPMTKNPRRYFSQSDEDGIVEKILIRLKIFGEGTVIEFGVGDGSENNSLALISKGWKSYWVGGEELCFTFPSSPKHFFNKTWVTKENVVAISKQALIDLEVNNPDVVSLDLDGNDYHFARQLLESGLKPDIWICEYNAKFPPGSIWIMSYDENHTWFGDDYFGASFSSFTGLFHKYGYFPVACSVQGSNIFFVKEENRSEFLDVCSEDVLYQPPFYYLVPNWGHTVSPKSLEHIFK